MGKNRHASASKQGYKQNVGGGWLGQRFEIRHCGETAPSDGVDHYSYGTVCPVSRLSGIEIVTASNSKSHSQEDSRPRSPEKALLVEILKMAIRDLHIERMNGCESSSLIQWFNSDDNQHDESGITLVYICETLNLDINELRRLLFSESCYRIIAAIGGKMVSQLKLRASFPQCPVPFPHNPQ